MTRRCIEVRQEAQTRLSIVPYTGVFTKSMGNSTRPILIGSLQVIFVRDPTVDYLGKPLLAAILVCFHIYMHGHAVMLARSGVSAWRLVSGWPMVLLHDSISCAVGRILHVCFIQVDHNSLPAR